MSTCWVLALYSNELAQSGILFTLKNCKAKPEAQKEEYLSHRMLIAGNAGIPVLFVTNLGEDPSQELQDVAAGIVGADSYHQLAMGQGQTQPALDLLHSCATSGRTKWQQHSKDLHQCVHDDKACCAARTASSCCIPCATAFLCMQSSCVNSAIWSTCLSSCLLKGAWNIVRIGLTEHHACHTSCSSLMWD